VAFERVDQQQHVRIDVEIGFYAVRCVVLFVIGSGRCALDKLRCRWFVGFSERAFAIIDLVAGMQTEHGRVRFRVWWQPLEVEGAASVSNALGERFELLTL